MNTLLPPNHLAYSMTKGHLELLSLRHIRPEQSRLEPDLYLTKWWDYKVCHHVVATYYWAWCYSQAARRYCEMTNDAETADSVRTFEERDIIGSKELTAAISARQAMDQVGCRYPWAMGWAVQRFSDRGWHTFPRPNQLYGEETLFDMRDAWEEEKRARLQCPEAELFKTPERAGMRADFKTWVINEARRRSTGGLLWMPLQTLHRAGYLDREDVLAVLPNFRHW